MAATRVGVGEGVAFAVGGICVALAGTVDGAGGVAVDTGGMAVLPVDVQAAIAKTNRTASKFFMYVTQCATLKQLIHWRLFF